jgi:thiamine biosynthesis lipoprotein ApbE
MRQHPASASRNDPYFQQRRRLVLSLPAFVCGVAIAAPPVQSDILRIAKNMMGTQLEICLQGRDPAALKLAANAAMQEMDRLSQMMSRFHPTSVVNALHYASGSAPDSGTSGVVQRVRMAKERSQQSHGAFDPLSEHIRVGILTARTTRAQPHLSWHNNVSSLTHSI